VLPEILDVLRMKMTQTAWWFLRMRATGLPGFGWRDVTPIEVKARPLKRVSGRVYQQ
jgi:hypothetical protein